MSEKKINSNFINYWILEMISDLYSLLEKINEVEEEEDK